VIPEKGCSDRAVSAGWSELLNQDNRLHVWFNLDRIKVGCLVSPGRKRLCRFAAEKSEFLRMAKRFLLRYSYSGTQKEIPGMEQRKDPDRRRKPTPMLSRYTVYCGRRSSFRRGEDRLRGGYVDRYSPRLFSLLFLIVGLNVLDAVFTCMILDCGGVELNPVVDWAITMFGDHFIIWKLAVSGLSLSLLCLHSKFRIARPVIAAVVILYSGVVAYQIVLISFIM
jgi:hypothetical protein